jgi:hypothetical protein
MKRAVLFISIAVNLALLAAIALLLLQKPSVESARKPARVTRTILVTQVVEQVEQTNISSETFDWSQVESEDFSIYARNLRGIGCPEQTVRDILTADIEQLFVRRRQELFRPLQNQFWDSLAKNGDLIGRELQKKVDKLKAEKEALLNKIVKGAPAPEKTYGLGEYEMLRDFLPPEKTRILTAISEKLARLRQGMEMDGVDPETKHKLSDSVKMLVAEQEQLLSPAESEELKLRKSSFAQQLQTMAGFYATEDELRTMARLKLDETKIGQTQVDEQIKALLGEARFKEYKRSTDSKFYTLNRVGRRYDLPKEMISQAYDLVRIASEQVNALKNAKNFFTEERDAALENLRWQTQESLVSQLGPRAADTYRRNSAEWDNIARP